MLDAYCEQKFNSRSIEYRFYRNFACYDRFLSIIEIIVPTILFGNIGFYRSVYFILQHLYQVYVMAQLTLLLEKDSDASVSYETIFLICENHECAYKLQYKE